MSSKVLEKIKRKHTVTWCAILAIVLQNTEKEFNSRPVYEDRVQEIWQIETFPIFRLATTIFYLNFFHPIAKFVDL